MTKYQILKLAQTEMNSRLKTYVDVAWFPEETPDEELETIEALQQLEQEGMIRATDKAAYNIISCFVLT
ncbi:hypothetical protein D4L89_RS21430 [Escherichia coli]|nr:hypothetical protein [Escherichia coli]